MRIVWIGLAGLFFSAVSCSDDENSETKAWYCYSVPSDVPVYCACLFTTKAALAAGGGDKPSYESTCPESTYGCCELESGSDISIGVDRCSCYGADDTAHCGEDKTRVSSCPDGMPVAVDGG
jgi:hypothetical protein